MRFSVKKVEVLVFLGFFSLFAVLGVWQVQRALEKRGIEMRINARSQSSARTLDDTAVNWDVQQSEYQKIKVEGEFLSTGQILVDTILMDGRAGYHVVSPLRIAGSERYILVNRGWVEQGESRQQLPEVVLPAGTVSLEGVVRTPSALPFVESSTVPLSLDERFSVWLYLDLEKYADESTVDILPFAMLQNNDSGDALVREWPAYRAKVAMHIGYALQWFAFALIVTLIFIGIGRKRGRSLNDDG